MPPLYPASTICGRTPSICAGTWNGGTTLDLYNQGLDGTIPTEIFQYTHLTLLRLRDNQLSGTLPTEIGRLTQLTHLSLYSNQLSGGRTFEPILRSSSLPRAIGRGS